MWFLLWSAQSLISFFWQNGWCCQPGPRTGHYSASHGSMNSIIKILFQICHTKSLLSFICLLTDHIFFIVQCWKGWSDSEMDQVTTDIWWRELRIIDTLRIDTNFIQSIEINSRTNIIAAKVKAINGCQKQIWFWYVSIIIKFQKLLCLFIQSKWIKINSIFRL